VLISADSHVVEPGDLWTTRLPAGLRVLKVNVGARRLYQRLGFVIVGETETHYDMRYG